MGSLEIPAGGLTPTSQDLEIKVEEYVEAKLSMFEFNQNDRKRDSGVKMQRLNLCNVMKAGTSYRGVLLSPAGDRCLSPADPYVPTMLTLISSLRHTFD